MFSSPPQKKKILSSLRYLGNYIRKIVQTSRGQCKHCNISQKCVSFLKKLFLPSLLTLYPLWVDVKYTQLIGASSKNKGYICQFLNFCGFRIFKSGYQHNYAVHHQMVIFVVLFFNTSVSQYVSEMFQRLVYLRKQRVQLL